MKNFIFKKLDFINLVGIICLGLWLIEIKNTESEFNYIIKFLRNTSLILLIPFIKINIFKFIKDNLYLRFVLLIFFFTAINSMIVATNLNFTLNVVLPQILSGIFILILISLNKEDFINFCQGVGFSSLIVLIVFLIIFHDDYNENFGRGRYLIGFSHPLKPATLVISSFFFLFTLINFKIYKGFIFIITLILLFFISSRNILISFFIGYITFVIYNKKFKIFYMFFALIILILPIFFLLYSILYQDSNHWNYINALSSDRFKNMNLLISKLSEINLGLFFGPTDNIKYEIIKGFANSDSVYLTLFVNFGLVGIMLFIFVFYSLLFNLIRNEKIIAFSIFLGILIFYLFDSQGITQSNIIIFLLFIYVLRSAIINENFYKLN